MSAKRRNPKGAKSAASLRASVSFPPNLYRTLEQIAAQKKVSVAWVVRDATEQYVVDQWPLLEITSGERKR
jgi:metal-responsive CopG/Arc/MetJ family transcriptional regulator